MSERIVSDPSQHGWVEVDGKWVWDASSGGAGAGMVISETEPTDKVEGMQWLNPTTGLVLFWDDEKWLQMPTTGAAGKDGADGVDGLWTDNGDTTISYNAGNVGIGASSLAELLNVGTAGQTVNTKIQINSTADSVGAVYFGDGTSGSDTYSGYLQYSHADDTMSIGAGGSERMTIDADGATTVRQDLDNPYTGTIDADTNMSGLRIWNNATATDLSSGAWFKTGGHWSGVAGSRNGNGGWGTQLSFYTHGDETDNLTQATERMRIGADGLIDMANGQVKVGLYNTNEPTIAFAQAGGNDRLQIHMNPNNFGLYFWDTDLRQNRMALDNAGGLTVYGNIYKQGGTPVSTAADLIEVLHTLREATKDESTLEGLRDSIGNAVGGLIEKFEAMQSTATQEISDE